jgi:2,3-bisphosphoglycerate-independent phosphoglycerate mutase
VTTIRPAVLVVCDGWGYNPDGFGNAIAAARTPRLDELMQRWPSTLVEASGEAVGLPPGQQGNSEVGHLTIGTGRVIFQDLPRISRAVEQGTFYDNAVLCSSVDRAKHTGRALHCIGLVSPGGVHSHQDHALALVELARRRGMDRVYVHAFTDGRDVPPTSAAEFMAEFEAGLRRIGTGSVATVCGRYYAMDRDKRWERTRLAYEVIAGEGNGTAPNAVGYIEQCYANGVTDEFIQPVSITGDTEARVRIEDGDSAVFFNFRPDRARQLCHALVDEEFEGFERARRIQDLALVTYTEYEAGLRTAVAFPKHDIKDSLAEVVSRAGLRQFHVAETEKYAHVTYFINGGREEPFAGEERLLIPSPRVATYDTTPAMSAQPITDAVVNRLRRGDDALIVVNFANADMVGHTGDFDATIAAVECVDACMGRIVDAALAVGGAVLMTADHGNAELKIDPRDGSRLTAHTTSPVPALLCGTPAAGLRDGGGLCDIAPTLASVLGLDVPATMTGSDLRR